MQFSGAEVTTATPTATYAFMTDPAAFFGCVPRVTDVKPKSSTACEFKVGASGISLNCKAEWSKLTPPSSFVLEIEGGSMLIGRIAVRTATEVAPHQQGAEVRWSSDVKLSGLIARQVDETQLQPIIDGFTRDVLTCFEERHAS
jgi:carbon monoxide dehydrogenase subunit G